MPLVTVHEIYSVSLQVDDEYPRNRRVEPRSVWFDTWDEASVAIERAMALLPPDISTVMVSRMRVDEFKHDESPDLEDWPAPRHLLDDTRDVIAAPPKEE